jgi:hypothetical protein
MTDTPTALDAAYIAMEDDPADDAARLAFYARLSESELFLLLERDAQGTDIAPQVFALEDGPTVLAFDREDRLAAFSGGVAAYAALPGRVIAAQLAGQGLALAVNLGAPSAIMLPNDILVWLTDVLRHGPDQTEAMPQQFRAPAALPGALLAAIDAKLARAQGLAAAALLAAVDYADGRRGHMLAFLDAKPGAEPALARAVSEALTFSGIDAGELDVTFLEAQSHAAEAMAAHALRFDLPAPEAPAVTTPAAPGMDPARPPKLRH